MQHYLDVVFPKDPVHQGIIGDVPDIEGALPDRCPVPPAEIVDDNAVIPRRLQSLETVAPHIAGTAAYQDRH